MAFLSGPIIARYGKRFVCILHTRATASFSIFPSGFSAAPSSSITPVPSFRPSAPSPSGSWPPWTTSARSSGSRIYCSEDIEKNQRLTRGKSSLDCIRAITGIADVAAWTVLGILLKVYPGKTGLEKALIHFYGQDIIPRVVQALSCLFLRPSSSLA